MKCDTAEELLHPLCRRQLSWSEAAVIRLHLLRCPGCREALADLRRLHAILAFADPAAGEYPEPQELSDPLGTFDALKRLFDIATASIVLALPCMVAGWLAVKSPFLLLGIAVIGAVAWQTSPGPLLSKHRRVGQDERQFWMYRFRIVPAGIEPDTFSYPKSERTFVGQILRGLKLDRLPEFINVLKGDMSIVGPTAYRPRFVHMMREQERDIIYHVRPGLFGQTQLRFRYERMLLEIHGAEAERFYINVLFPIKCMMEAEYVLGRCGRQDLWILVKTAVLFARVNYFVAKPRSLAGKGDAYRLLYGLFNKAVDSATLNVAQIKATYTLPDAHLFKRGRQ